MKSIICGLSILVSSAAFGSCIITVDYNTRLDTDQSRAFCIKANSDDLIQSCLFKLDYSTRLSGVAGGDFCLKVTGNKAAVRCALDLDYQTSMSGEELGKTCETQQQLQE
jgi:hypothetical protein